MEVLSEHLDTVGCPPVWRNLQLRSRLQNRQLSSWRFAAYCGHVKQDAKKPGPQRFFGGGVFLVPGNGKREAYDGGPVGTGPTRRGKSGRRREVGWRWGAEAPWGSRRNVFRGWRWWVAGMYTGWVEASEGVPRDFQGVATEHTELERAT